jgi:hypothetical protein
MLQLQAGPFVEAFNRMGKLAQMIHLAPGQQIGFTKHDFTNLRSEIDGFHQSCVSLGLAMCAASTKRLLSVLDKIAQNSEAEEIVTIQPPELVPMRGYMDEVANRLKDELGARLMLIVPLESSSYFEPTEPLF